PTEARTIVYVIDRSMSMGLGGALATAKQELLASLERLPATARFQVIAYNRSAEPLLLGSGGLEPATPEKKRRAASLIEGLDAVGGTEHVPALKRALALRPDVIYFLSDGDDLQAEQVRALTVFNRGRSIIHAIELGHTRRTGENRSLQILARENHG